MRAFDHATFNVGIPTHLKLDALAFQHRSEVSIYEFFALVSLEYTSITDKMYL